MERDLELVPVRAHEVKLERLQRQGAWAELLTAELRDDAASAEPRTRENIRQNRLELLRGNCEHRGARVQHAVEVSPRPVAERATHQPPLRLIPHRQHRQLDARALDTHRALRALDEVRGAAEVERALRPGPPHGALQCEAEGQGLIGRRAGQLLQQGAAAHARRGGEAEAHHAVEEAAEARDAGHGGYRDKGLAAHTHSREAHRVLHLEAADLALPIEHLHLEVLVAHDRATRRGPVGAAAHPEGARARVHEHAHGLRRRAERRAGDVHQVEEVP
mmetsp:Transcript_77105/g.223774  ORF Transcript_77105/g.223774 Transcript_77105/m.223774 type:complete len:276 (-) Transcript_77105:427-1254(-)